MISVQNLCKRFGTVQAVDGVTFSAADGEVTGLLGPNGAGKTTTLRMLYSLLPADSGQILVDGEALDADNHSLRSHLGVVPDAKGLYPRLTARENITYFGRMQGLEKEFIAQRIEQLSSVLGMEDLLERRCDGFSQGQRVKVAIARALIHQPRNILLDEPSNGLDVMSNRALRQFILDRRAAGDCILLSTHIMQEVAALCDRIVVIASGRVITSGTPEEILAQSGESTLEDAFVTLVGAAAEGLMA